MYAISHTDICLYCFVAYVSFLYAYILSEKKRRLLWQFLLNYFCWVSDFPWMPLQFPVCKGLGMRKLNKKQAVIIGLYFGGFQALMPLIGLASWQPVPEVHHQH